MRSSYTIIVSVTIWTKALSAFAATGFDVYMAKTDSSEELIPLSEAARRYGLSPTYLRQIARKGRLKAKKIGRGWLTTPLEVENYIASRSRRGAFREDLKN